MKSGFCELENLTGIRAIGLEKTPMKGKNLEGIPFETEVWIAFWSETSSLMNNWLINWN